MFTAQGTETKQNLQTSESNKNFIYRYIIRYTMYTTHNTLYTVSYT